MAMTLCQAPRTRRGRNLLRNPRSRTSERSG